MNSAVDWSCQKKKAFCIKNKFGRMNLTLQNNVAFELATLVNGILFRTKIIITSSFHTIGFPRT